MSLQAGDKLGPYEILAPLGAGGMGEVYRARDPRMGREVAVKMAFEHFTERFSREVRAVAALNHPNICHLYDVGPNYLVMELVEGPTLSDRIKEGPVPLEETLTLAKQIADALEAAHEKGIVHRDLKPANIKVRPDGTVKVLDFGLAKMAEPTDVSARPEQSPTLTLDSTRVGMLVGTAAYMAPEQARGKPVDKRADIWAFGVVLCEMVTGRQLFHGDDITSTLAAVVLKEPDLELVPAKLRLVLRRCLEKDPKRRLRDISGVELLLEEAELLPATTPSTSVPLRRGWLWPGVAAALLVSLAALSFFHFRETPPIVQPMRFELAAPASNRYTNFLALSPDGRKIAFSAIGLDGRVRIWVRALETVEARAVALTTGGNAPYPFWSSDSRFIAVQIGGKMKKVEAAGGPEQTICDTPLGFLGGAWNQDGTIIFGSNRGLMRVPAAGGEPVPLTAVDSSGQESAHVGPAFLPDGRHFLYLRRSNRDQTNGIYVGSLDAKPEQQDHRRLLAASLPAAYATSGYDKGSGHILFLRESTLMAQPFDARKLALTGDANVVAEPVASAQLGFFAASANGVLAYRAAAGGLAVRGQLTWFDRAGKSLGTVGEPGLYNTVALSPDGTRAAVSRNDPEASRESSGTGANGNVDIWLHEFSRGTSTRFTFDRGQEFMAVWSPNGSRIIFSSDRDGSVNLYQKVSNGAGTEEALLKSNERKYAYDWSQDGRFLLYAVAGPKSSLWVLPLTDDQKPKAYLQTESNTHQARFSADSRWVAYTSDESGQNEVYVRPFPSASGGKWMVSNGGGSQPRWRRDGKELFYISADSKLVSVEVAAASGSFQAGIPKALFAAPIFGGATVLNVTRYDVTADGKKFLINSLPTETTSAAPSPPIIVVLNWAAGLKR